MSKDNVYYEIVSTINPMNIKNMKMILFETSGHEMDTTLHWHNALEITWIREGCIKLIVTGNSRIIKPGEITFVNIGDIHMTQNVVSVHSKTTGLITVIPYAFIRELVPEIENPYFEVSEQTSKILATYLEQLAVCMENKPAYMNLLIRKQLISIVYQLFEKCYTPKPDSKPIISKKVVEYVNQEYANPLLTLKSVAKHVGLQEKYFCKYFKQETGITFHKYLCTVRLNAALELLKTGQHSELECALDVGFTSSKTMIDWCKKIYDCTPYSYTKLN